MPIVSLTLRRLLCKKQVLLFALILTFVFGCKKDEGVKQEPIYTIGNISGEIVLPVGSPYQSNDLEASSPIEKLKVQNGKYDIRAFISSGNIIFVTNPKGEAILMSYNSANLKIKNINSQSTAIGLVMATPAAIGLTEEGKEALAIMITNYPEFNSLVAEVDRVLKAGGSLFDEGNSEIYRLVDQIISRAAQKGTADINATVLFWQDGRTFAFYDDRRRIFSSVVGFYKNGLLIDTVVVQGTSIFPNSINDLSHGNYRSAVGTKDTRMYVLQGDGQFDIKARTGRPDQWENSLEFRAAFDLNYQNFVGNILESFSPPIKMNKKPTNCFKVTNDFVEDAVKNGTYNDWREAFMEGLKLVLNTAQDYENCIMGNTNLFNASYFRQVGVYYNRLNAVFIPGRLVNTLSYLLQWGLAKQAFDTCMVINGNSFTSCNTSYRSAASTGNWKTFTFNAPTPYSGDLRIGNLVLTLNHDISLPAIDRKTAKYELDIEGRNIPQFNGAHGSDTATSITITGNVVDIAFKGANFHGTESADKISGIFTMETSYVDRPSNDSTKGIILTAPVVMQKK